MLFNMGVVHFLLLGGSPGAASVGLSYCVENYSLWKRDKYEILESVVVVTTQQVLNGSVSSTKPALWNRYGTTQIEKHKVPEKPFDCLKEFIADEYGDIIERNRGKIDQCIVKIDDFQYSVLSLVEKVLEYRNKEVWLNITGGMNPMTVQSLFTAYLGGIIAKIYYTYVSPEYTSYLKPPFKDQSENFRFIELPVMKADLDPNYYIILQTIEEAGGSVETGKLRSRLKSQNRDVDKNILNKMRGHGVITYDDQTQRIELTQLANTLLHLLKNKKFREYLNLVRTQPA